MAPTNARQRNKRLVALVGERIRLVREGGFGPTLESTTRSVFDDLCKTTAFGFREVVLTCAAAWTAEIEFDPLVNFYECNPRAVYEQGVRPALVAAGLPHMKSGPLNVAKNIRKLDMDWAVGRRPESAAKAAVQALMWVMEPRRAGRDDEFRRRTLLALDGVLSYLIADAARLASSKVTPRTDLSLYQAHDMLVRLIEEAADSGNTPQVIVGHALKQLRMKEGATLRFEGRACETNTTAKKPADIWLEGDDGRILHLYEVTVKPIDQNRLEDSAASVIAHGRGFNEVVWLCRLPGDVESLGVTQGSTRELRGVRFEFVDLKTWLQCVLELVGAEGRAALLRDLGDYVASPSVSEEVKVKWKQLQAGRPPSE